MKKRCLLLLLAMVMVLGLVPTLTLEASADPIYAPGWTTPDAVTITTQTETDVKVTTPVYSACGSLFWDPSCWTAVEKIDNIWLTISGNPGFDIWSPSLQLTLTLPDGFEFRGTNWCSQTYEKKFTYSGQDGDNYWTELPDIYPTYVGDAEPGKYYYVQVMISGTFKYRAINDITGLPNLAEWIGEVNTYNYVPFLYVEDAWNSVEVTHPDIGSYTIDWAEEDAYQSKWSYNSDTSRLCAALSAISGDKELTLSTLAQLGFADLQALTGDSAGSVNGIGMITGTKYLTDTAYTISVLVGADDPEEWMGSLAVNGSWDIYSAKIYEAAYELNSSLNIYHNKKGVSARWRYGEYVLFTGFGRAGAAAAVLAKMPDDVYSVAYTFGAPNVRRQGQEYSHLADHAPDVYNLIYWQDPICASPSGQYYQALGDTYYVLESAFNPVSDRDGDGLWSDRYGVTYETLTWTGDYVYSDGSTSQNLTQYATVNEIVAAALYAWDPYDPDADGLSADTIAYLAQVNAILGQYGLSLNDVSNGAHSMNVYWQPLDGGWTPSSTNAASFHYRLSHLYNTFFAPESGTVDTDNQQDDPVTPTTPTTPDTQPDPGSNGGGSSVECHTFEGNCGVTVTNSAGQTVASITSSPYDASVARSSVASVLVCVAGNQKLVMITDPSDTYTIRITGSEQDQETTVKHTVYQTVSGSDTVTVLTQGDMTVSSENSTTVPAVNNSNITTTATEHTYAKSTMATSTAGAAVAEQPPTLYSGNSGAETVFSDIPSNAYYADAVAWAVAEGVTSGTTATTFSPNAICTRAQLVTFLWRAAGSPAPTTSVNPFTDAKSGTYYYDAVLWAVEKGITVGTTATTFSPDATVTRGQTVTFLYRYAGSPAVSGGNSFTDVSSTAYYADAVRWAVANEVTNGTSTTTFSPESDCTRAQIVTFLYRYIAE